jgi:hypothetical protein
MIKLAEQTLKSYYKYTSYDKESGRYTTWIMKNSLDVQPQSDKSIQAYSSPKERKA